MSALSVKSIQEQSSEVFVPVIGVIGTPDAEDLLTRNNRNLFNSIADLFSPFALVQNHHPSSSSASSTSSASTPAAAASRCTVLLFLFLFLSHSLHFLLIRLSSSPSLSPSASSSSSCSDHPRCDWTALFH